MKKACPSEAYECEQLVRWLESKNYLFCHVNSSQFTRSFAIMAKNKKMGVRKGCPDYVIVTPTETLFVEMKRISGGRVSPEQLEWISKLNKSGVRAGVCAGFEAAKKFVEEKP